ncbi:hypothetical protein SAMN05421853_10290 [Roseivivax halotolerans]|uniref:Homeodomain-like domain-containing protein n=1 Tax=Roseivivax halotolerans TaxID=93684 RepID=A0A1I5W2T6_9RHOB|nr:hypothetical protein [Roseivivax halotolerans]SFQ13983.1 hypothetical protein SAMN05421853_10290 [Roseivivax halotolerans]
MSEIHDQLIACLGEIDTQKLLRTLGGTRIEVPQTARRSKLSKIIGPDGVARLIATFGPGRLVLPMGDVRGQAGRRAHAKRLLTEGAATRDVARQADLHTRSVERYRRQLREDRQLSLFDDD